MTNKYHRKKEQNICPQCNTDVTNSDHVYCKECREKQRKRSKQRYNYRKNNGLCVICGDKTKTEGLYCDDCSRKKRKTDRKYRERKLSEDTTNMVENMPDYMKEQFFQFIKSKRSVDIDE